MKSELTYEQILDLDKKVYDNHINRIIKELGVSQACAAAISYARTRKGWSSSIEEDFIEAYEKDPKTSIMDF